MHRHDSIEHLLQQAEEAATEEDRADRYELACRAADRVGDVEAAFTARLALTEAAIFSGQADRALVAFGWCLAQCDRRTTTRSQEELFWPYKWIVGALLHFPNVAKSRILETWTDMARRYDAYGVGERAKWMMKTAIHSRTGDIAAAREAFQHWVTAVPDEYSDCVLCDDNKVAYQHQVFGEPTRAVAAYRRIVRMEERCRRVPQSTYALMLQPLLELGYEDEALDAHRRGLQMLERNRDFLDLAARHVRFRVWARRPEAATRVVERFWPLAEASCELDNVFAFLLALRALLRDVGKRLGEVTWPLRVPHAVALPQGVVAKLGVVDVEATAAWLDERLAEIAGRFDRRNGNDTFSRRIVADREADALSRDMPIGP